MNCIDFAENIQTQCRLSAGVELGCQYNKVLAETTFDAVSGT